MDGFGKEMAMNTPPELMPHGTELDSVTQLKIAALRREIQIGIDAAERGEVTVLKTDQDIENFMAQFYR
ncbi:MAG: hypothetical protein QM537_06630 [Candidatus Symbiobacter sp.]|nr:hypothetical protein [Candidatus Symbiobacter sp.]